MIKILTFLILTLVFPFISCSDAKNFNKAYAYEEGGKFIIKLKGKRKPAVHDPGSVLSNKSYEDSLVIQVQSLQNGIIRGKNITVRAGHYKYSGNITIQDDRLQVSLSYDNTDDKTQNPVSWNGKYALVRN